MKKQNKTVLPYPPLILTVTWLFCKSKKVKTNTDERLKFSHRMLTSAPWVPPEYLQSTLTTPPFVMTSQLTSFECIQRRMFIFMFPPLHEQNGSGSSDSKVMPLSDNKRSSRGATDWTECKAVITQNQRRWKWRQLIPESLTADQSGEQLHLTFTISEIHIGHYVRVR